MANDKLNYGEQYRVSVTGTVGDIKLEGITTKEVILGENILNPSVQTSVTFNRHLYSNTQSLDTLKGKNLDLTLSSDLTELFRPMKLRNTIYRLDSRRLINQSPSAIEEFTIHACDQSLLEDAKHLMCKSWKCATPDEIVKEALKCIDGYYTSDTIQSCQPQRDYIAENIHPLRVIAQQANMALDGEDPSFVHYMTYGGEYGQHHFTSLKKLISSSSLWNYRYSETNEIDEETLKSAKPYNPNIVAMNFPCDFDYLTDLLNGVNDKGANINTGVFFNAVNMMTNFLGIGDNGNIQGSSAMQSCFEGGNMKQSWTNKGASHQDYGCETDVEKYLLKRQARMALLDRDKIAARILVYWNPYIHVGDMINVSWQNKESQNLEGFVYGSGEYLVTSLMHKIQLGGYSTTTVDCVSKDVLQRIMN